MRFSLIWLGLLISCYLSNISNTIADTVNPYSKLSTLSTTPLHLTLSNAPATLNTVHPEPEEISPVPSPSRTRWIIGGISLATAAYGFTSWWDKSSSQFQVRHENWFEADSPNGGADKLGHSYSTYVATRLMTQSFLWAGHTQPQAIKLAGLTSGLIMLGVEVMDGFTQKYGFSPEDALMNLTGIGLGVLFDSYPQLDETFDIRLKYWTSDDAKRLNDYDPIADYSGQTYVLATKTSGIPGLREIPWVRYLEFDVGYGTRGYQPTDGTDNQPKYRNLYYGISLNFSLLFDDWIFKSPSKEHSRTQSVISNTLEYVQFPAGTLWFEHHL